MKIDSTVQKIKKVTRNHVAELAGVSPTIVSYVMNNNRYVDEAKRKRVLLAIKELNYQPNIIAKSLKCSKSNHIAFIADEIANEYFPLIMLEMEDVAYQRGYIISLCHSRSSKDYVARMISRQFDGIAISTNRLSEQLISCFSEAGIPMVIFGNRIYKISSPNISFVNINIYGGAQKAMNYLIEKGHRKIVYIDNIMSRKSLAKKELRFMAYVDTLKLNNIEVKPEYYINADSWDEVKERCMALFTGKDRPTAVFANDDMHAFTAMSAIKSAGISIPEQVAVIGFDNSTLSRFSTPSMTTVEIPKVQVAKKAIEILLDKIEGKEVDSINLDTKLIIRGTT